MTTEKYDLVVLGTGNAGMGAAGVVRAVEKSVAIVESRDVGGTCPLRGCVPKKVLVAAAQVLDQIDRAAEHKISVGEVSLDWGALMKRERTFVDGTSESFEKSLKSRGIELIRGAARFTGPNTIQAGERTLEAAKTVIATGSKVRPLPIAGAEHLITSDEILEMAALPESLIFIGGGVIAMEFAHVFQRAGAQVTVLEAMPQLLPRLEGDVVERLRTESERIGIEILTDVNVTKISREGDAFQVAFEHDGKEKTRTSEKVANGTGRIPDVEDLDLDAGGIDHDGLRIQVDPHLKSMSNGDVYVAGDALWSSAQLSPVATYEGRMVGKNILQGDALTPEYVHIPSAVYTVPALASVGLTEAEAQEQGLSFEAKTNDMAGWMSGRTYAETAAYAKVLVEDGSARILGAHIIGHGAEEIIHLFALAMKHSLPASELATMVYGYPTFSSDVKFLV